MYKIIYMKADFEPWWQLEDWEKQIVSEYVYDTKEQMEEALEKMLKSFREKYQHEESREGKYFAFWSDNEKSFCEACDEDLQIFHGLIVQELGIMYNGN
ncbi:DUF1033 family protein [Ureibacillus thermophilus]|uniref:DUF1033 family protein n=1 Tax=Ureibacillus thermophilus TaxID=367743 RepID=A0A4P6UWJ2_9BACL|nr:DUF1033 family protein [Ureibacillus thermophilus]QBK26022.1 DUF1033 family protein [Ureibacillus thermophilus]